MQNRSDSERLIERLGLEPHPEGGYYRETYRAEQRVVRGGVQRTDYSASTAIYYLLRDSECSTWHRIQADELWHFYAGDPIEIMVIDADGTLGRHILGCPLDAEASEFQVLVPGGSWFAARRMRATPGYALAGCTVAPGFEFSEFELADVQQLALRYPLHQAAILALQR